MPALAQVPDVERVAVLAPDEKLGIEAVLDHVGSAPLARDHGVVAKVPGEVVGELLRAAIDLPPSQHLEAVVIEDDDSAGPVAVLCAKRADVDPVRGAVDRVEPAVSS